MTLQDLLPLLGDPEEGPLLRPFFAGVATEAQRERYLGWLEGQPGPRGEAARRLAALREGMESPDAPRLRRELEEALGRVRGWWALVRPVAWVLNCGEAAGEEPAVRFAYECARSWETLVPTGEEGQRYCGGCGERVFLCGGRREAEEHALAGRCIAVSAGLAERVRAEVTGTVTGRPHPPELWGRRLPWVSRRGP